MIGAYVQVRRTAGGNISKEIHPKERFTKLFQLTIVEVINVAELPLAVRKL
jgi:hypothetical protein